MGGCSEGWRAVKREAINARRHKERRCAYKYTRGVDTGEAEEPFKLEGSVDGGRMGMGGNSFSLAWEAFSRGSVSSLHQRRVGGLSVGAHHLSEALDCGAKRMWRLLRLDARALWSIHSLVLAPLGSHLPDAGPDQA